METIVKNHESAANAIINRYLSWAQTQLWYGRHIDYLYDMLSSKLDTGFNNKHLLMDSILLPEQANRCCYCMRMMVDHNDEASIEHIVPQSLTSNAGLSHYFSARSGGLNAANVCLSQDFFLNGSVAPPYPHHVAYHNFVVACRKCNSERQNYEIEPLFLFAGIHAEVSYDQFTGEATWQNDPALTDPNPRLPVLSVVGVNRPLLKAIRVVWFYVKRKGEVPTTANRSNLIYGALGDSLGANPTMSDNDFEAYLSLNTDEMWNLFLKYDYFG